MYVCRNVEIGGDRVRSEQPELNTEAFDVEDVITASGGIVQTIADAFWTMLDNAGEFFRSMDSNL